MSKRHALRQILIPHTEVSICGNPVWGIFCVIGKFSELPYNTKTLRGDRTAAEEEYVEKATRRRRRILRVRILYPVIGKFSELPYNTKTLRGGRTAIAHVLWKE